MKFTSYGQTDTGQVRQLNEDNMRIVIPDKPKDMTRRGQLLVVADGMGGHDAGEVASSQAVETIADAYYRKSGDAARALKSAIEEANSIIFQRAEKENHHGMGTTVVAAARIDNQLYVAHVGDSRLYLIRERDIYALTNDHSLVAEQIAAGILTPEEALNHPLRNVISRAVGTSADVDVEISAHSPVKLEEGDIVLLCSDGLTEHVREHEILEIVLNRTPKDAAQALINAANADGGRDNITIIIGRVGDMPPDAPDSATVSIPVTPGRTKRLPVVAVKKKKGAIFWFRAFFVLIILLGLAGAAFTQFGPNLGIYSSIHGIIYSPTPTVTPTLTKGPLETFTPETPPTNTAILQPITPVLTGTLSLTPTATLTVTLTATATPIVTATPTASATRTVRPTNTEEPGGTTRQQTPDRIRTSPTSSATISPTAGSPSPSTRRSPTPTRPTVTPTITATPTNTP
ncbi:MAG: Stp1/IreP family PP2C-type Ser/Thr phosphatase [Ardenticatenaceae bacterium]